jgi:hypothetical protein
LERVNDTLLIFVVNQNQLIMIDVTGAVLTKLATRADRSIVITLDLGELVKLGDFDGMVQMPLRVVLITEDELKSVDDDKKD